MARHILATSMLLLAPATALLLPPVSMRIGTTLLAAVDPFLDPDVWGPSATAVAEQSPTGPGWTPVMTGIACYAVGMAALSAWYALSRRIRPKLCVTA